MNDVKTNDVTVTEDGVIDNVFSETVPVDEVALGGGDNSGKNRFKLDTKTISKLKEWTFLFFIVGIAIIQFAIMWVGVKFSSIILAFQEYSVITDSYHWVGFANFKDIFKQVFVDGNIFRYFLRSASVYFINLSMFPVHILTSYCIWKKVPFSNFLKVFYFIPSILPGMVLPMFFKYFMEIGWPKLFPDSNLYMIFNRTEIAAGRQINPNAAFYTILAWNCIQGFAGGIVLYLGTISSVNESVVEYGKLDGLGALGEFYHIIMPHIWPLFSVQIIGGVVGVLTSDIGLLQYYGSEHKGTGGPPDSIKTIGFMMNDKILGGERFYGWMAAWGLFISAIAIPLTFLVRHYMEKWGPSED